MNFSLAYNICYSITMKEVIIFEDTSTTIMEGVSNDVLIVVCLTVLVFIAIILWYKNYSRNTVIHPNHRDNVQAARESVIESRNVGVQQRIRRRNDDDRCPICIDHLQFAVETNCGHMFCSK